MLPFFIFSRLAWFLLRPVAVRTSSDDRRPAFFGSFRYRRFSCSLLDLIPQDSIISDLFVCFESALWLGFLRFRCTRYLCLLRTCLVTCFLVIPLSPIFLLLLTSSIIWFLRVSLSLGFPLSPITLYFFFCCCITWLLAILCLVFSRYQNSVLLLFCPRWTLSLYLSIPSSSGFFLASNLFWLHSLLFFLVSF